MYLKNLKQSPESTSIHPCHFGTIHSLQKEEEAQLLTDMDEHHIEHTHVSREQDRRLLGPMKDISPVTCSNMDDVL